MTAPLDLIRPAPALINGIVETYGRLTEGIHITGYTFERACAHLEWLLVGDRWKSCGDFPDVNAFLDGLRFNQFRTAAETRKRIAERIKALQPTVSNRQIARTLGVSEATARRDASNDAAARPNARQSVTSTNGHASNVAPPSLTGDAAAKAANKVALHRTRGKDRIGAEPGSNTCCVDDLTVLSAAGNRYGTIYADPPWPYGNQGTRAATGRHYDGMTIDDIAALPIAELAAEDAHLHLWTTNAFLFECHKIIEAWGFEYKSCYVWVKPQMGIGNYWRVSHEFLLFAVRGSAPFRDRALKSWGEFDRGEHSGKPDQVRNLIERASPGPRLELFGRRVSQGWTVWGDEIENNLFRSLAEVAP